MLPRAAVVNLLKFIKDSALIFGCDARPGILNCNIEMSVDRTDADFNRAISLGEFREAAIARFQLLDTGHTGMLSLAELEGLLPKLPPPGAKPKHAEGPDTRVGNPLPKEN